MAIEESKIKDIIEAYEGYREECKSVHSAYARGREGLCRTVVNDLKKLLPRKTLADLNIYDYGKLTGVVVEFDGKEGIVLGGGLTKVVVFALADKELNWCDPALVFLLNKERVWNESGVLLSE